MSVKIYHNPRCSKSRQTLELIRKAGIEPEIIEYLKTAISFDGIYGLVKALGLSPRELMRKGEAVYKENNLSDKSLSDDALITAMVEHPILIERPVVETAKGCEICRPPEKVKELL